MCSIGRVCYLALVIALLQYRPNISVDCGCTLFYVIVVIWYIVLFAQLWFFIVMHVCISIPDYVDLWLEFKYKDCALAVEVSVLLRAEDRFIKDYMMMKSYRSIRLSPQKKQQTPKASSSKHEYKSKHIVHNSSLLKNWLKVVVLHLLGLRMTLLGLTTFLRSRLLLQHSWRNASVKVFLSLDFEFLLQQC